MTAWPSQQDYEDDPLEGRARDRCHLRARTEPPNAGASGTSVPQTQKNLVRSSLQSGIFSSVTTSQARGLSH